MRIADQNVAAVARDRPEVPDVRTAAYIMASTRVAETYQAKGL